MVIITTTPTLEGMPIKEYKGIIHSNIVIGTNMFSDIAASFTDVFGGNSGTYQNKMNVMYEAAKKEMQNKALQLGANAIVGYRTDFDEISGKGKSMFMLSATGTACLVEQHTPHEQDIVSQDNTIVSSNKLSQLSKTEEIFSRIEKGLYAFSDEDWEVLYENPSVNYAKILIKSLYPVAEQRLKVDSYVSMLDREEIIPIVYNAYKATISRNVYGANVQLSHPINELIINCKLFDANEIISLFNDDIKLVFPILDAEKDFYTSGDLALMKELLQMFSQLPDKGSKTRGKLGMFGKEEDIWICPNGHKNSMDSDFCTECNLNIKGFTKEEYQHVEKLEKKVRLLDSFFKQ